ncbi:MAG: hypothetical protein JXR66_08185 [Bacteroidales bacterium]|nr:hypothetical protein [Bacteroidales bacterium]MBN2633518.1 hypothetical protein [Bacteroidales bacterium]
MKTRILISFLVFFAFALSSNAQNNRAVQNTAPVNQGVFIDTNNNGVCDSYERPGIYYRGGRGQGQGIGSTQVPAYRRGLPAGQGRGMGRAGNGGGRGLGPGQGRGLAPGGRFYSDQNKNGVCDFYEQTNSPAPPAVK